MYLIACVCSHSCRYNTGDEIRFVKEKHLRLPAEKRAYAYRVELAMVGTIGSLPLFLMVAIQIGVPTLALMGILIASAILAVLRTCECTVSVCTVSLAWVCSGCAVNLHLVSILSSVDGNSDAYDIDIDAIIVINMDAILF